MDLQSRTNSLCRSLRIQWQDYNMHINKQRQQTSEGEKKSK